MNWQAILFSFTAMIFMLVIARYVYQAVMKINMHDAVVMKDCPSIGIAVAGYLFGVVQIIAAVLRGDGHTSFLTDALIVSAYGIGGIVLLSLLALFGFKWIHNIDVVTEVANRNTAAGIIAAGGFISTSLVIAGTVSGDNTGGDWLTAIVFFLVGQVSLHVLTRLYRILTAYDDAIEINNGNTAAALAYAGVMIGIALAIHYGLQGEFVGYGQSLIGYGKSLLVIIFFYPIRQFLVQGLVLGSGFAIYGGELDKEIARDRNISVGTIEAAAYIGTSLLITQLA
ncbi:MAG: DUF350 domain-containing protein [Chloroherpetonaceae bacterium]|nr:DUF350 domain-containing protein [Chloroherpetonaceae bacterium]